MIDTVCLLIPLNQCIFLDKDNKEIPDWDMHSKTDNYQKFVRNPSKKDKASGMYFPRITLFKRRFERFQNVKIEFSAPKLLYNNNLEELTDDDFEKVVDALLDRLKHMGVRIFRHHVVNAKVSAMHFSKNIQLTEGYTSSHIISEIGKIDLRKSFDFARARFVNDGQSLCAHTAAHELVIYDKIADLNKGKKRAVDRDQTPYQSSLFEELKSTNRLVEVLRIEIRLCKRDKINSLLKLLDVEGKLTFKQLFSSKISQKVLGYYWERIVGAKKNGLFTLPVSSKDLLRELFKCRPDLKPNRALYLIGLSTLAKDGNGLRELRTILTGKSNDRTWYRIIADHRELAKNLTKDRVRDWVMQIDREIEKYTPFTRSTDQIAV